MTDANSPPRWTGSRFALQSEDGLSLEIGHAPCATAEPTARIILVHGVASHMGWYQDIADALAQRGYEVFVPDRRGSGSSAGPRGHTPSWQQLVRDLDLVAKHARALAPQRPLHVMGVSLGAVTALAAELEHPGRFDALFLATPAVDSKRCLPVLKKLIALARGVLRPRAPFQLPFDTTDITPDGGTQARVGEDELRLRSISAGMALAIFRMRRFVRANLHSLCCPVGLLFADEDHLVDNDRVIERFAACDPPTMWMDTFEKTPHFLHDALPPAIMANHVDQWFQSAAAGSGPARRTTRHGKSSDRALRT